MEKFKSNYLLKLFTYFQDLDNKSLFLVMEYCPEGNLRDLIDNNKYMIDVDIPNIFSRILRGIISL